MDWCLVAEPDLALLRVRVEEGTRRLIEERMRMALFTTTRSLDRISIAMCRHLQAWTAWVGVAVVDEVEGIGDGDFEVAVETLHVVGSLPCLNSLT